MFPFGFGSPFGRPLFSFPFGARFFIEQVLREHKLRIMKFQNEVERAFEKFELEKERKEMEREQEIREYYERERKKDLQHNINFAENFLRKFNEDLMNKQQLELMKFQ